MFGNNTPRPRTSTPGHLQVHEVFLTLQGEGPFSGHASVFVRLSGCNLRCWFCDTKWDDENDPYLSPIEILHQVNDENNGNAKIVVLTGGEPLRQDLDVLIPLLLEANYEVQIETAGVLWQECVDQSGVNVVVSPKTPRVHSKFFDMQNATVSLKYVVTADWSDRPTAPTQRRANGTVGGKAPKFIDPATSGIATYIQPCDEYDPEKNALNLKVVRELALAKPFIAGVQLHKSLDLP